MNITKSFLNKNNNNSDNIEEIHCQEFGTLMFIQYMMIM